MSPPSLPPSPPPESTRPLTARRCARHSTREAIARCPDCGQAFCRECISEHAGRLLCASCLAVQVARESRTSTRARGHGWIARCLKTAISALALWMGFYFLGKALIRIPPRFHEGTIWRSAIERSEPSSP